MFGLDSDRTVMKTYRWSVNILPDNAPSKEVCLTVLCLFILMLGTLVFFARRLFAHFISPLLDTCFNSCFLSDLLLFIPSLFSRAWPLTLIPLHAVFHTILLSLPVSPGLTLIHAYIYISSAILPLFSIPHYRGHADIYILRQLINGLPWDTYNTPASLSKPPSTQLHYHSTNQRRVTFPHCKSSHFLAVHCFELHWRGTHFCLFLLYL